MAKKVDASKLFADFKAKTKESSRKAKASLEASAAWANAKYLLEVEAKQWVLAALEKHEAIADKWAWLWKKYWITVNTNLFVDDDENPGIFVEVSCRMTAHHVCLQDGTWEHRLKLSVELGGPPDQWGTEGKPFVDKVVQGLLTATRAYEAVRSLPPMDKEDP